MGSPMSFMRSMKRPGECEKENKDRKCFFIAVGAGVGNEEMGTVQQSVWDISR